MRNPMQSMTCAVCGREFIIHPGHIFKGHTREKKVEYYCSWRCQRKREEQRKQERIQRRIQQMTGK